jgi:peptidyl-prolyl cis-trans isomerase SurA
VSNISRPKNPFSSLASLSKANPVKSEFGWHLIQVLERREAQLTVEKQREFARAAIRERKFEQAYQDWIRELRDTATVKILNVDDSASAAPR